MGGAKIPHKAVEVGPPSLATATSVSVGGRERTGPSAWKGRK